VPQNRLTGLPDSQTPWIPIHPQASVPISIFMTTLVETAHPRAGIGLRVHRNFRGEARGEIKAGEGFKIGLYAIDRSLADVIRLRHREGPNVAWELSLVTPQRCQTCCLDQGYAGGDRVVSALGHPEGAVVSQASPS
jgi:hypothetical protein